MRRLKLTLAELCSWEIHHLAWLSVEPYTQEIRGKDAQSKGTLFEQLNNGQKAIFMFYVFHNHVESPAQYYWFASYYVGELQIWPALLQGMEYLRDEQMLVVYKQLEDIVERRNRLENGEWREALAADLDHDAVLRYEIDESFSLYNLHAPGTIQRMNGYVQDHLEEFIEVI
ncbi:hypothetical protein ACE3MQ_06550 [Paenibacillus lentus]|uniref:hypothetical protein n=1 Tax=Paenibacillus lentus TaxID=1338368 RepID=UPI003651D381